jgi:hypothetical protein
MELNWQASTIFGYQTNFNGGKKENTRRFHGTQFPTGELPFDSGTTQVILV